MSVFVIKIADALDSFGLTWTATHLEMHTRSTLSS